MTDAPAFILFTDDYDRAVSACFGGDLPSWAAVYGPQISGDARAALVRSLLPGTKSLGLFFHKGLHGSEVISSNYEDLRQRGTVIGLDAAQLSGLAGWLAKNQRRAGEPVATLIAAGCSAFKISEMREAS